MEPKTLREKSKLPLNQNGEIDTELIKELYMKSPHIAWTRFAEEQGYDSHYSRRQLPVQTWQGEKQKRIAENQADILKEQLFNRQFRWHDDIIKTLENYPKANDMMLGVLFARMEQIHKAIKEDKEKGPEEIPVKVGRGMAMKKVYRFNAWDEYQLSALTMAIKAITESKYKSLMLHNWSVELANTEADEKLEVETQQGHGFLLQVRGYENGVTPDDWQKMLDEYLDKPREVTPGEGTG